MFSASYRQYYAEIEDQAGHRFPVPAKDRGLLVKALTLHKKAMGLAGYGQAKGRKGGARGLGGRNNA